VADKYIKRPSMVLYWYDTRIPLTYKERQSVLMTAELIEFGPCEILIFDSASGRKVCVRGVTDPTAPPAPAPKALA